MPVQLPSFAPTGGSAPHGKGGALGKARAKYERHSGKAGSKSKTGRSECSQAVSDWKTSGLTPAISATLGKCRAAAHAQKQAALHKEAGNDLKAASLQHRSMGEHVGKGARAAKARELLAARKAKATAAAPAAATVAAPHPGQPMAAKASAPAPHATSAHVTSPATGHTAAHHRAEAEKHSAIADAHGKTVKHFETFVAKGKAATAHQRAAYDKAKSKQIMARHEAAHHHGLANAIEAQGKVASVPHVPTVAAPAPAPAPRDKSAQLDRILGKLQARRDAAETAKRSATDAHIKSKILGKPDAGQHEAAKGAAAARLDRLHRHAVTLAGRAGKQNAQTKAVGKKLAAEDRTRDQGDSAFGAREAEVRGSMVKAAGLSHTGPVKSAATSPTAAERAIAKAREAIAKKNSSTPAEFEHAKRIESLGYHEKMDEAKRLGIKSPEKHYQGELTTKMARASVQADTGHGTAFHGTAGKAHTVKAPEPPKATVSAPTSSGHTYGSLAHVDTAFDRSHGANNNFVPLSEFRAHLGGTREQQDAIIRAQRLAGRLSLDTHEGLHLTPHYVANKAAYNEASIHEGGSKYVYISRHDAHPSTVGGPGAHAPSVASVPHTPPSPPASVTHPAVEKARATLREQAAKHRANRAMQPTERKGAAQAIRQLRRNEGKYDKGTRYYLGNTPNLESRIAKTVAKAKRAAVLEQRR